MNNQRAEGGFTLIELVVVIVIIGILAAAALPRFVDLTSEAEEAAADGLVGALAGGVSLVHGKALATDASGSVDVQGQSVSINTSDWPDDLQTDIADILQQDPTENGWSFGATCTDANMPTGTTTECLGRDGNAWAIGYDANTGAVAITDSP